VTSAHDKTNGAGAGLPRVPSIPLSDEASASGEQSIGGLVKDATTHISTLIRGEFELAKSEVVGEVKKGLTGSVYFIVAFVLVLLFLPFVFVVIALSLNDMFDWEAHPWLGFLVIVGAALIGALLLFWRGAKKFKRLRAPERTIASAKDTMAALRNRGDNGQPQLEPHRG
jgi:uncharacterized integral membrane protein